MDTVYLVDKVTHIVLPESEWGNTFLKKLSEMGHVVEKTDHPGETYMQCIRDYAELERAVELLNSTGL